MIIDKRGHFLATSFLAHVLKCYILAKMSSYIGTIYSSPVYAKYTHTHTHTHTKGAHMVVAVVEAYSVQQMYVCMCV